ncbi:unnamed protein product [Symbiodinium natans]|uniref:Uncharacterized protein n=1 Tax=Symbiodinium natans TaxID=878477 RepID=A0A812T1H0_9DINO|nr:unnamed protein product [Symbiodinium natans]
MSSLDSRAAFKARALELNFPEEALAKLAAVHVDTFGSLAFIGPLSAGNSDEGPLVATLKRALGQAPSDQVLCIARRLWFESTTQALAEMRGKVERTDTSEPVRMPLAERTQRISELQKRLVGIHWSADVEPSHKLQDLVAQMVADQSLLWLPWERLTSRALEITTEKVDHSVGFDSAGNLKLLRRSSDPSCSTLGEYAIKLALQCRSLAFELGRICRYEHLERWHDQLLQTHMRSQPPGMQRVSLQQLREADKMLWTRIAEDTRGALSIRPDGSYPFEASLAKWQDHTQVQCYLIPLLKQTAPDPDLPLKPKQPNKPPNKPVRKDRDLALKPPTNPQAPKTPGEGDKKKTWTVPSGCHSQDAEGKRERGADEGAMCAGSAWDLIRLTSVRMNPVFRDDETGGNRYAAEQLASSLLSRSCVSPDDLLRLSLALPSEVPARGVDISGSRSVSLGAFACSKLPGLLVRDTSKQHPLSTRVFSRFVRGLCPDFTCTTIAVFTNLKTDLHQDTANDPASQNLLYPLTAFSEGGVWCEDPAGSVSFLHRGQTLWGYVLEVSQGLCFLPAPNRRHATLPWKGDRSLLVCYSAKGAADMPSRTRSFLEALQFPLPPATQTIPRTLSLATPMFQADPDRPGPLFVELFAGCARLSKFCHAAGFRVLPVDSPWNPHRPEHPVLVLDLTEEACQQQLLARLLQEPPFAVHIALPCGTGSRARERPISKRARLQGAPDPRPLRDGENVLGLPGLSEKDQFRVDKSNELCRFVIFLLQHLPSSCQISIENPENSWIWAVLAHFVRASQCPSLLKRWSSMREVCFSNCMKGGKRPKRTRFRCSHASLQSMEADCDGLHEHLPYLVYRCNGSWSFSTAQEAEYPAGLCSEMASLLSAAAGLPARLDPPAGPRPLWPQQKGARKLLSEFLEFRTAPPLDRPLPLGFPQRDCPSV